MSLEFKNPDDLRQKTYYLAGKMSGIPQFNVPEFFRVAAVLRQQGHRVINPAELDEEHVRLAALRSLRGDVVDLPGGMTGWAEIMGRDIAAVLDEEVDAVAVFDNWPASKGAKMEVYAAYVTGKPVVRIAINRGGDIDLRPISVDDIERGLLSDG